MTTTKSVGIRELKNELSAWIREVQHGTRVLVTDRRVVVAEMRKPGLDVAGAEISPVLQDWLERGILLQIGRPGPRHVALSPVRLPDGTAQRILDEDRGA